jgi:hypothetical protein
MRTPYYPRVYTRNPNWISVPHAEEVKPVMGVNTGVNTQLSQMGVTIPSYEPSQTVQISRVLGPTVQGPTYGPITLPERGDGHGYFLDNYRESDKYLDPNTHGRIPDNYVPPHERGGLPFAESRPRDFRNNAYNAYKLGKNRYNKIRAAASAAAAAENEDIPRRGRKQ